MKRVNVLISEEAREILDNFQKKNGIFTIDDTVDRYVKEGKE
jgi:hypothetical protein